ncbi:MAG TPA: hypothetical protein VGF61_20595 [Candidatus Acidoferrum sp.]
MRYRVIALTLPLALSLSGLLATQLAAQDSQDTSVAEAARRAQEQKKSTPKSPKVITNDNLPGAPKPDAITPAGTQAAPSPSAPNQLVNTSEASPARPAPIAADATEPAPAADTTPAPAATADAKAPPAPDNAAANPEVAALKRQIADQQKEVDLLMRLYALDQDAFLVNPDHAKDPQGKAKLDTQQEEIHAKVAELAALKAKLDAIAPGESAKVSQPKP